MIKKIFFGIILISITTSCVSSKIYEDLQDRYDALKAENESLMAQLDANEGNGETYSVAQLRTEVDKLNAENTRLKMELSAMENNLDRLQSSYDALEANSSSALTENLERNRKLLEQLEAKEKQIGRRRGAIKDTSEETGVQIGACG